MGDVSAVWVFKTTAELESSGARGEVHSSGESDIQCTGSLSGHGHVPA